MHDQHTAITVDLETFMLGNFPMINIRTTPYHINVNSAYAFFVKLFFVAAIDYKNILTMKISRFTVL